MRITALVFALGAATVLADDSAAAVLDVPVTPLVVRLYADPSLASAERDSALREALAILTDAGFVPEWLACAPAIESPRCTVPLTGAELAVRLIALAPSHTVASPRQPLGYSLIDPRTRSGALATIYLDRVAWLAADADADAATLLGRAIAHEIGHLLLGTTAHANSGVMRAVWSRAALRGSRPGEWRFATRDARQMRAGAAQRARPTTSSTNRSLATAGTDNTKG